MLLSELHRLSENKEVISIERDCHDEELTGILGYVSDTLITMQLFEGDGEFNGFAAFEIDQIEEVYWGNREHKAIAHLVSKRVHPEMINLDATDFLSAITELNEKFLSLSFHTTNDEDHYSIASIENYEDEWVKLLTYSAKRTLSRMTKLIKLESISRVVVDSPYQNKIVELHSCDL